MKELVPLTISYSIRKRPTVLLTQGLQRYLLIEPVNSTNHVVSELYCSIFDHFKVEQFDKGVFSLNNKKYLCQKQPEGAVLLDEWYAFQWKNKRQFNRFIRPRALFDAFMVDLYFPLFGPSLLYIIPGKKDRFMINPFPEKSDSIEFLPVSPGQRGLGHPAIRSFFKFMRPRLKEYHEDFLALHHDKLATDLKYKISLYPELRNVLWGEVQQCFDNSFKTYTSATINNYILQL